jgi:uncharacterized protein YjbI with pentapeptide repeats
MLNEQIHIAKYNKIKYCTNMFSLSNCNARNCLNKALSFRDNCITHLKDRNSYIKEIHEYFQKERELKDLELTGITLKDLTLNSKAFKYCNMSQVVFENVNIKDSELYLSYFDFCIFKNCTFTKIDCNFICFAGSQINNCKYTDSELVRCNFVGIKAEDLLFESCDLYSSRFINSLLTRVKYDDCNLKSVRFEHSTLNNVTYPSCNAEEAFFREGAEYNEIL